MALKFKEKLKGIDLCKGKESLSDIASSVSKLFNRKRGVGAYSLSKSFPRYYFRFGYSDDALSLTTV